MIIHISGYAIFNLFPLKCLVKQDPVIQNFIAERLVNIELILWHLYFNDPRKKEILLLY